MIRLSISTHIIMSASVHVANLQIIDPWERLMSYWAPSEVLGYYNVSLDVVQEKEMQEGQKRAYSVRSTTVPPKFLLSYCKGVSKNGYRTDDTAKRKGPLVLNPKRYSLTQTFPVHLHVFCTLQKLRQQSGVALHLVSLVRGVLIEHSTAFALLRPTRRRQTRPFHRH